MRILAVTTGHDASVTILEDGVVEFYLAANKITRHKHDNRVIVCIEYLIKTGRTQFTDIVVDFLRLPDERLQNPLKKLFDDHFEYNNLEFTYSEHHLYHAYSGFFNSPFKEAVCLILDGAGALVADGVGEMLGEEGAWVLESESVYHVENEFKEVYKKYYKAEECSHHIPKQYILHRINDKIKNGEICEDYSVGYRFELVAQECGFGVWGSGKVMGLASYKGLESPHVHNWKDFVDKSYNIQKECEDHVIDLIKKYSSLSNNIVLSGGYVLNCVANYKFKNLFPHLNFFIDPVCADDGISLGLAYKHSRDKSSSPIKPLKDVYIGTTPDYKLEDLNTRKTSYMEVAKLLNEGFVVGICQGKSEAGYRALGNRSILFDPREKDGMEYMNSLKGRESFRPFAGTVLEEHAHEWFDIDESPYMQYAVKVKKEGIPAIVHVDNTCRVQTVSHEQNYHFYNLIKSFYEITGVPILGNTSFNYAGEPIVETFAQVLETKKKMNISYLFLPDINILVED